MPTPKRQAVSGPISRRAVDASASITDETTRSIRLSFSSETPYLRANFWDEPWIEVLGHGDDEIDLSRLNSGAGPLLWGHNTYEREDNIGIVEKAWTENGKGYADVRLSMRPECDGILQDLKDGILRNVSVGYQIRERTLVKQNEQGPSEYRVTSWLPMEISLVSIPADDTVGVGRSAGAESKYTLTDLPNPEDKAMPQAHNPAEAPITDERQVNQPATPSNPTPEAIRAAAQTAERQRITGITELAQRHGLDETFIRAHVDGNSDLHAVRLSALEELAKRQTPNHPQMTAGRDVIDKQRDAAEAWLLQRCGEKVNPELLNGNEFRGASLLDIARRCLEARGIRAVGLVNTELATRAITQSTSDFPLILGNVMNKTLLAAYMSIPDTWRTFAKAGTAQDFRPNYRYRMGGLGDLQTVLEDGTFTYMPLADGERNVITAATKGRLINLSRQMIVNDDLGAFTDLSRQLGRSAARTVEKDVYTLLNSNPTMPDGFALFSSQHANLLASGGTAPTVAAIDAARQAMANQLDVGGQDYTDIRPAVWLGPVSLGGAMRVVNEAQYDVDSTKFQIPNKSRGLVRTIQDTPRLTGTAWYLFADPNEEPVIEVDFLNGQQAPYTEMQQGFEVDGVVWKVRLDYGVGAVGYRGAYKNPGA